MGFLDAGIHYRYWADVLHIRHDSGSGVGRQSLRVERQPPYTIQVAQHLIVMALKPSYSYRALRSVLASCNTSIRMIKC
jgi:hypothetical protein